MLTDGFLSLTHEVSIRQSIWQSFHPKTAHIQKTVIQRFVELGGWMSGQNVAKTRS